MTETNTNQTEESGRNIKPVLAPVIEIDLVIYPFSIIVFTQHEYSAIKSVLEERIPDEYHKDIELFNEIYDGKTVLFPSGHTVISLRKSDRPLIVHEVFHATSYILDYIGIPFTDETKEGYAYLMQFIFGQIDSGLSSYNGC